MTTQNYKNHRAKYSGIHLYLILLILVILFSSLFSLGYRICHDEKLYTSLHLIGISIAFIGLYWHYNRVTIKLQNRIIKQELNFRHYILFGTTLDPNLSMGQIVALRFASDGELQSLIEKTLKENLKNSQIKKEIKNWVGDYDRV
ncbi:MAG: DUF6526 family protein [Bacteroidota bacterium]|nr:DUF6526 family protein [Bacteroidota bacterium]